MIPLRHRDHQPVLWQVLPGLTPYGDAIAAMHLEQERIASGQALEAVWLLESPPGFNPGCTSRLDQAPALPGHPELAVDDPVGARRGGDWTYHGPGVRGGIVMLNLAARRKDIQTYGDRLHQWLIDAAAALGITAQRRAELEGAGVWVGDGKLAAIGLNVKRWVTGYGFAFYVAPNLIHFTAMAAPCGVVGKSVTSLANERHGPAPDMASVDAALRNAFHEHFGPTSLVS